MHLVWTLLIFLNMKNLESVRLDEPHVAVIFSCRTMTRSAKVSCRTLQIAEPRALNSEKDYLPSHLRPVIIKPVGLIFEISDSNPTRGKCGKCGRPLSPYKNKGLRRFHRAKLQKIWKMQHESADTKMRKVRKMRPTGFNVTGFR